MGDPRTGAATTRRAAGTSIRRPEHAVLSRLRRVPIVQAPMAGGAAGPALAAAVTGAGALGFLAAGYRTAEAMREQILATRGLTGGAPFGVNLFLPQPGPPPGWADALAAYRARLEPDARGYGVSPGEVPPDAAADDFDAKLDVLLGAPVAVVGFTFGAPPPDAVAALRAVGTFTVATVTTPEEAAAAARTGVDALSVQGAEAGGHQAVFPRKPAGSATGPATGPEAGPEAGPETGVPTGPAAGPGTGPGVGGPPPEPYGLLTLLALVREMTGLPLFAAGGIMTGRQIAGVLAAGAIAAQPGTAFLRCPESGAPAAHKAALVDPRYPGTVLTRAFSGRRARGLANAFAAAHEAGVPPLYPHVHHLTAPIRRAAAAQGDPSAMALWAGQGHRLAREEPAADVVARLMRELDAARAAAPDGPGPHTFDPDASGPHTSGPHTSDPHTSDPHTFGPDASGPGIPGPHAPGRDPSAPEEHRS